LKEGESVRSNKNNLRGGLDVKRIALVTAIVFMAFVLVVGFGCDNPAPAPAPAPEPITLKAISYKVKTSSPIPDYIELIDRINQRAKGELIIEYLGGTEVVDMAEQPEAVKTGVVDMNIMPGTRFAGLLPVAYSLPVTSLSPMVERSGGYYDYMVEQFKTGNMFYLGRNGQFWFYLATNKAVEKPQELAGQKIRSSSTYNPFVKALGASPVSMKSGEIYLGMERGVVDGYIQPIVGLVDRSLPEVTDYLIDHYFYEGSNPAMVLNLDSWNGLPKHLQDLVMDTTIEFEKEKYPLMEKNSKEARQTAIDQGMEPIKFSTEDAKWYRDLAYSAYFDNMKGKVSPEAFAKVMELLKR